jgi:hypothetical protein
LVESHLSQQQEKERDAEREQTALRDKRRMVADTLASLQREVDKLVVLEQG